MGLNTFNYDLLPQGRKEGLINKRNMKIINEFLRERKKQQVVRRDDLVRLKELRRNGSIDGDTYRRLKNVMILTHEKKRIKLIDPFTSRSYRREGSVQNLANYLPRNMQDAGVDFTGQEDLECTSESPVL
jgi:translation initiation factor IF-3